MCVEDKMNLRIGRKGSSYLFKSCGSLKLNVADEKFGKIKIQLINKVKKSIELKVHPNVDKELFRSASLIGLKDPTKSFPTNTEFELLKWHYQTKTESSIPLESEFFIVKNNTVCIALLKIYVLFNSIFVADSKGRKLQCCDWI